MRTRCSSTKLEVIIGSVENARKKEPKGYKKKRAAKLFAAVLKVAFEYPERSDAGHLPRGRRGAGRAKRLSSARSLIRRLPAFYAGYLAHRTLWPGMTTVSADDRPIRRLHPAIWKKRPLCCVRSSHSSFG
jgi:hypothetical protein